jgi:hypothetical protein
MRKYISSSGSILEQAWSTGNKEYLVVEHDSRRTLRCMEIVTNLHKQLFTTRVDELYLVCDQS